jgi:hypothetical protein
MPVSRFAAVDVVDAPVDQHLYEGQRVRQLLPHAIVGAARATLQPGLPQP